MKINAIMTPHRLAHVKQNEYHALQGHKIRSRNHLNGTHTQGVPLIVFKDGLFGYLRRYKVSR